MHKFYIVSSGRHKFTSFVSSSCSLSLSKASPWDYSITIAFALLNLALSIYARVDPAFFSFLGYYCICYLASSSSSLKDSPLCELISLSSFPSSSLVVLLAKYFLFFTLSGFPSASSYRACPRSSTYAECALFIIPT